MVFLGRDLSRAVPSQQEDRGRDRSGGSAPGGRRATTAPAAGAGSNLDKLKLIADALLEHETISSAEIDLLFAGKKLDRPALHPAPEAT